MIKNSGSFGMWATGVGSQAMNRGTIENGGTAGMLAQNGATVINEDGGVVKNKNSTGMSALVGNSQAINRGLIENTGANGMLATMGTIINDTTGIIRNTSTSGMFVNGANSIAVNKGLIENLGDRGMDAAGGAVATNEGIIQNGGGSGSTRMFASGINSIIINKNIVNVNVDGGVGMTASQGARAVNEVDGIINLNSKNSIGMLATGVGSVIENKGTINLGNNQSVNGWAAPNDPNAINTVDNNKAFVLQSGGTLLNTGTFRVDGSFDTSTDIGGDGTGKFEVGGGIVEAASLSGDFYASGALAMGGYKDTQDTYRLFKAENMYANIKSNSAMYDAALTKDKTLEDYYGIEMTRKDFKDIIDNSSFASYLENNYKEDGSTKERKRMYDALKLLTTELSLNRATNQLQGNTIYPAFTHQTLSNIRGINRDIQSEVFSQSTNKDIRYIGFGKYRDSDVKIGDNIERYSADLSTITLGLDRGFSDSFRIGILGTFGKSDYTFDNNDSRKDDIYQGTLIGSYEKNGFLGTASVFYGKTDGDIKRNVAFSSLNSEMKGDLDTTYYGVDLGIQKRYEAKFINIVPRVEFNLAQLSQDKVNERGDYALNIDSIDSTSVESGIGFTLDKVVTTPSGIKIIPNIRAMYYRELGTPYKDMNGKIASVSTGDNFKIDGYNVDKNRGEFSVAVRVEINYLELNAGVEFKVDDKGDEVTPFIGIGYRF